MAPTQTLTKDTDLARFEEVVEQTHKIIVESKLSTPRDQIRKTLLDRFAQMHGVDAARAEEILNENSAKLATPPAPEPSTPEEAAKLAEERTETIRTVARTLRATKDGKEGPYFWENPQDAAFLDMFIALRQDAGLVANLLVTGPSGCGKTEGLARAAVRKGLPVYKVDCASITTADRWVGHKEIDERGTHYVLSEHLRWISAQGVEPGFVIYDEINRLHPTLLNILFPILDGSQKVWVPDLGIHVDVHPDTIFTATANIGTGFTGTHKMDDALAFRFGYRLERDFPPANEEITILEKRTGVSKPLAKTLVEVAVKTREKARNGDLSFPVATRNLLDAAALVSAGMTIPQAGEFTFIKMYSEDGGAQSERVMVRQIVAGKSAGK